MSSIFKKIWKWALKEQKGLIWVVSKWTGSDFLKREECPSVSEFSTKDRGRVRVEKMMNGCSEPSSLKREGLQHITSSNHSWGNCSYSALTAHSQHDTLPGQGQFSHLFCLWVDFIALVTPCCFHHLCSSYLPFTGNQTKIPKQRKILNSQII